MKPDFSGDHRPREGYGANKVAMEFVLRDAAVPISILRPSRIHGSGAARPREWYVVSQLLAGQRRFPLVHAGCTGNHPTAAVNRLGWFGPARNSPVRGCSMPIRAHQPQPRS